MYNIPDGRINLVGKNKKKWIFSFLHTIIEICKIVKVMSFYVVEKSFSKSDNCPETKIHRYLLIIRKIQEDLKKQKRFLYRTNNSSVTCRIYFN